MASSISLASPVSFEENVFLNTIVERAIVNNDKINFRFSIKDKYKNIQIRTEKPHYKLYLDKANTQFVYFSVFYTGEWIYIYIPDKIPANKDEPYTYTTYNTNKQKYYKGNHISLSYSDFCNTFLFHYTEYNDNYVKKPHKLCNFKFEGVTESNIKCIYCDEYGKTFKSGIFVNDDENDYDNQKHVFDIVYKIITILKMKKQFSKNNAKIILRKEERETARKIEEEKERLRQEAKRIEDMHKQNRELVKAKRATNVLLESDANLLKLFGESLTKTKKTTTNAKNAKKK